MATTNQQIASSLVSVTYPVVVDYSMKFEDMIRLGRYDQQASSDFSSAHFPINGSGLLAVELKLVHIGRAVTTEWVEDYLDRFDLKGASTELGLAFGAKYPEVQLKCPVICLGSYWTSSYGGRDVLCLRRGQGKRGFIRRLYLRWVVFDDVWDEGNLFLAMGKQTPG